jgi:hypothetical protein
MIDLEALPKAPHDALNVLCAEAIALTPRQKVPYLAWIDSDVRKATELRLILKVIRIVAARVNDEVIKSTAERATRLTEETRLTLIVSGLEALQDAIYVFKLGAHFLGVQEVEEVDLATLPEEERKKIHLLLNEARKLTVDADFLTDSHKRRLLYRISKAEAELFKEKAGLEAFLAAAAEISGVMKKVGEDAEPISKRIQEARTITERHVHEYAQIGKDEAPKQLPKPDASDEVPQP